MRRANNIFTVPHRRKRDGQTNYKKRIKLLSSSQKRLVVRKSLNGITASLVEYSSNGDKVIAMATARDLKKLGWDFSAGNMPGAYLIGLLVGKKAQKGNVKNAILDIGLYTPVKKSRLYAVLLGALDSGLAIPHSPEVLPAKERVEGAHIAAYASVGANGNQFVAYKKHNLDVKAMPKKVAEIKAKILNG